MSVSSGDYLKMIEQAEHVSTIAPPDSPVKFVAQLPGSEPIIDKQNFEMALVNPEAAPEPEPQVEPTNIMGFDLA